MFSFISRDSAARPVHRTGKSIITLAARILSGALCALTGWVCPDPAAAQTVQSTTDASAIQTMEKFEVSDVPPEKQVLPTTRPVGSVFGDDRSILDTPRSVSTINKAWMEERQIHDSTDFSQFAAGVYSPPAYGIAATPTIRGDPGAIYFNGQIGLFSGNNVFPSFNGVESMDIVKGPGSAVYGPQNNGVGGYVNLVNKKPYFDGPHLNLAATLGYWTSGHSYANPEFTVDYSAPVSDKTAYRISYLSRYGEGYAQNQKNSTQDLYIAVTHNATKNLTLNWFIDGYSSLFNENTGVNRVTEAYLGQQLYWAGSVLPNNAAGQSIAVANTASYTLANGTVVKIPTGGTNLLVLNPATAHLVKLYPYQTMIGPSDTARAHRYFTQLQEDLQLTETDKIVNKTFFDNAFTRKYELYGFDTYMPLDYMFDDRAQYEKDFSLFGLKSKIITGLDYRLMRTKSYSSSNEPYFLYDLTQPSGNLVLPVYATTGVFTGWKVPGAPTYSASPGSSTQDSRLTDYAAFYQQDIQITNDLSVVLSYRLDRLGAQAASPYLSGAANLNLPAEPYGAFYNTYAVVSDPSYFESLVYKLTPNSSVYFSFDRVNANSGGGLGGVNAYSSSPVASPPHTVLVNDLKALSKLYEVGYKGSFLGNTLYTSLALYHQQRVTPQISPAPNQMIVANGIEAEIVYQPSKKFTLNANFTYQDLTSYAATFSQGTASYLDGYPTTLLIDGKYYGLGAGSPTSGAGSQYTYTPPTGKIRTPGLPADVGNVFATYDFGNGLGIGMGPQMIGRRPAATYGPLYIYGEYQLDGFVYYRTKKWDVQVNVKNITNQVLFDPISASSAGNDVILPRPPITASLTFRVHL
jgi:outer membrane receptor protein involved in Fe transport